MDNGENKELTYDKNKKILVIFICIAVICICIVGYLPKVLDPYRLFRPIISVVDSDILDYDGCYEGSYGVYRCNFTIVSDNAEGVGNELKLIYDKANQLLKEKNENNIEIFIDVPRVEHGVSNIIAVFQNYYNDYIGVDKCYYICYVQGRNIDSDAAIYDSNYDYEINHKEYWDYFSGADIVFLSDNIV